MKNMMRDQYIMDNTISGRRAEIDKKVRLLRADMAREDWKAVYIRKSENFAWLTAGGDNIVTRYKEDGVCAILVTDSKLFFFCNNIEEKRMKEEEMLEELGFEPITFNWYEDETTGQLQRLLGNGSLASDVPLPGAVDANPIILNRQKVLCVNEIARYLHLGKTFSRVIEGFIPSIRPGDTEIAIAGGLAEEMWKEGLEPVLFLVATDQRIYDHRHPVPTSKKLEKYLMISCNARYKGLITKITRMAYFGKAPEELKAQYEQTVEIENLMADATKPGVDDLQILELSKKLYEIAGYPDMWRLHHQGGPQSYTNGFYLIAPSSHEVVRLNQCYGYNPSITGTKTEDGFIVTERGPMFITYPVTFPEIRATINGVQYSRPGMLEVI
ncbi:MAG: M24 family metallopeptidase [Eubacteriales bacterium]|nr:M24 family metallopeptidase [Eubacteriales bacterium]